MAFQFVDNGGSDGVRTLEEKERRQIRSHVMKGRNLHKRIRRGKCHQQKCPSRDVAIQFPSISNEEHCLLLSSLIPGRVGDEWACFQFAFELKPYMRHAVFNFLNGLSDIIYPMQVCLQHDSTADIWFRYSLVEPAYLHCLLALSMSMMGTLSVGAWHRPEALFHLGETLRLANEKLQRDLLSDPLFAVIVSLAIADSCRGNYDRALVHLNGLQGMLDHVGGFSYLNDKPSLQSKILRFDVDFSVRTGSLPRFYYDGTEFSTAGVSFNRQPSPRPDFQSTFNYLYTFTVELERKSSGSGDLHPLSFHATVIYIYYRLLIIPPSHGLPEALRLASLAFMTTWFGYGYCVSYTLLGAQLKEALVVLDDKDFENCPSLMWTLFIGAISVFKDGDIHQLSRKFVYALKSLGLQRWTDTLQYLKQFPWVTRLHGKATFEVWGEIMTSHWN
ncbi:hypothetical protein BGW36DRAFT_382884 [Talaromyces proteolyticus]|uniref:Uncharacterized protein n=1 Tax=Talaromyces proteolyticus TaxID=1131652 RepID=A0AAD4KLU1_9EURO|nr:uncharacterized protein BGW36DRAFT_382884 [Talaromyces proteolyticus]KAH8695539.1 hypothetical protein BGW36DRAFT_382884 [Talaromyces proteolyticus]